MKRSASNCLSLYIVVVMAIILIGCGSDELAPSNPASSSILPDIIFFNDTGSTEYVRFSGTASDNTSVTSVNLSFDGGASFAHTATITGSGGTVSWEYLATAADFPAPLPTVVNIQIRAIDSSGNMSDPGSGQNAEVVEDSTTAVFRSTLSGATAGDVIALSSGIDGAYGNSITALTIPINVGLTILGSGYGSTVTSGGLSFPAVASTATVLQASVSSASIFSVDADLTIKNMRLLGAENAVRISDSAGPDPQLSVADCVFDRQGAWAVYAEDDDWVVDIQFASSIVDASYATSSSRGGLFLDNVTYQVEGSEFYYHTDPGGPADGTDQGAAIQVVDGGGEITESIFEDNGLAIWASGGDSLITSCNISSTTNTTYGINLTGGPGTALIRRNTVDGNTGYGLRVGGEMELTLRNNAITNNELSGVLIDSTLSNTNLTKINMGESTDQGRNLFDGNSHPNGEAGWDNQVFVTLATSEGITLIPANWNYWGVSNSLDVNRVIIDGNDNVARATLAIGSSYFNTSEVGP